MLLVLAFSQGRGEWLSEALSDRVHHPYRAQLCPLLPALSALSGAEGINGVALSGAGPSVLVFLGSSEGREYRHHLDSLGSIVRETGIAWHISSLDVERQGARVLRPEFPSGC